MDLDKETENQIHELQNIEKNLQNTMMQKQTFQLESTEVENALEELKKSGEEIYKISGNIMIKASKVEIISDLKQKKDLVELRLKALDSQEKEILKNSEALKKKILAKVKK